MSVGTGSNRISLRIHALILLRFIDSKIVGASIARPSIEELTLLIL